MSSLLSQLPDWIKKEISANLPDFIIQEASLRPEVPEDLENRVMRETEPSSFEEELLQFIRKLESRDDYNSYFGKGTKAEKIQPPKPISEMTLGEVLEYQNMVRKAGGTSTAVGAYQIIQKTLKQLMRDMNLREDDVFDEALQDKMALKLLERRGLEKFKSGKLSLEKFGENLAKEWASLPVLAPTKRRGIEIQPGQSYYKGVGSNKSLVKSDELEKYKSLLALGMEENNGREISSS